MLSARDIPVVLSAYIELKFDIGVFLQLFIQKNKTVYASQVPTDKITALVQIDGMGL